jgi:hypothetical protein
VFRAAWTFRIAGETFEFTTESVPGRPLEEDELVVNAIAAALGWTFPDAAHA